MSIRIEPGASGGSSGASSVSNADGTLTISPTTGNVVASIALGHANNWTGEQTFSPAPSAPGAGAGSERWGSGALVGSSTGATAIGNGASVSGNNSTVLGNGANTANANTIALGVNSNPLVDNSFVAGSSDAPAALVQFGTGYHNNTPTAYTIAGTYGFGSNINGSDLNISGGKSTGTGVGGAINFQTSTAGTAGSSLNNVSTQMSVTGAGNVSLTNKISTYNNISTAGYGVPSIYGSGRSTGQTGAVASVATYTVGSSDGSFIVSANANVTTFVAGTFGVTVAYTDETNTAQTLKLNFSSLTGTLGIAIAAAGPFEGIPAHIRCKAATAVTIATSGTFTSLTYNVEGYITQIG